LLRLIKAALVVLVLLTLSEGAMGKEFEDATSRVGECGSITSAQPGTGVAYKGTVRNSDYGLSVEIPSGQTGWGAAAEAPFHGFTIFLADQPKACIFFEIHLRIAADDGKTMTGARSAKRIKLGNRNGWENQASGLIDGIEWTNITVRFAMHHLRSAHEIDDGSITLVTRTQDEGKNLPIFRGFIKRIRFDGKEFITSGTRP
jgi:hypothetical protein